MKTSTTPSVQPKPSRERSGRMSWLNRRCRRLVLSRIGELPFSGLRIIDRDGTHVLGREHQATAEVRVHDLRFWRMMATGGSVGAGEAYVAGLWDASDLTAVIRVLALNRDALTEMERGTARFSRLPLAILHRLNRNSLEGSRRNISAHYDLGNDFFSAWLDGRMQYSSALYTDADESLDQAQHNKLARIAERLRLGPDDHLLEIGTGWGGLAIFMARETGCRVTTTTISRQQYEYAKARIAEVGLEQRIELLFEDYRALEGQYDKLVSVEMIEAVGADYLDGYMAKLSELLKPEGLALVQAITIEDFRYAGALKRVDFIQRYIFPGSFMPSVSAIVTAMARATDLALLGLEDIGDSYAHTLASWRSRFEQAWPDIQSKYNFDEAFRRRWRFYLSYCEGGFLERAISDVQLLLARPQYRKASSLQVAHSHAA